MKVALYDLLPAVYRNRDYYLGEPLRALVTVLGDELDVLRRDIDRLYDNWFIETCDEWVVPYIGDLLAASGLHPGREGVFSLRAFVANTLAYRRRKGTASVLENIAQDVSGWSTSVSEFFQLLTNTQHFSHVRPSTVWSLDGADDERIGTVGNIDIRKERLLASLGTAFDTASRTIDIRPFTQYHGWHNIDRLGIFLWRLRSYPLQNVPPRLVAQQPHKFYFHPLGLQVPLFANPQRQSGATERRREWEVPHEIDGDAFAADPDRYYGDEKSILITIAGQALPLSAIIPADLAGPEWPNQTLPPPSNGSQDSPPVVAYLDVECGRLEFDSKSPIDPDTVEISYHYGFSADIGGGPYGREVTPDMDGLEIIQVAKGTPIASLGDALAARQQACSVIRIMDSGIYSEPDRFVILQPGEELVIEAADGARPTIVIVPAANHHQPRITFLVDTPFPLADSSFPPVCHVKLDGLLVEGRIWAEGDMVLELEHCTLLPSRLTELTDGVVLEVPGNSFGFRMEIDIDRCILGGIRTDRDIRFIHIRDSIVDAFIDLDRQPGDPADARRVHAMAGSHPMGEWPGATTIVERSTILGAVYVRAMPLASESIFNGHVLVDERQHGCMKYCYIDSIFDDLNQAFTVSRTPRRFRCQPDVILESVPASEEASAERQRARRRVQPIFSSTLYGQPTYGRLSWRCPTEIRTGAEDGSEMGAFGHLMEPQREANLREAVRRYLPFGLEMNVIYADEEKQS